MAERKVTKVRKIKGLKNDGTLTKPWSKFKDRIEAYADTPVSEWTEYNFLGHILKRYENYMGSSFPLSYSGSPSKCSEIYCVKRMLLGLGLDNPQTVVNYIDFIYDKYIIPGKVSISSLAYFFTTNFIFEFKKKLRKESVITRTTQLPSNYQNVITNLNLDVCTYGDLAFARVAIENDPDNNELSGYITMFNELKNIGFDDSILGRLDGH
jgi:hypothetical protein